AGAEAPFQYAVGEVVVTGGRVHAADQSTKPAFKTDLQNLEVSLKNLSNARGAKADVTASFDTDGLGRFNHTGTLQLTPLAVEGKAQAAGFRLARLYPYIEPVLNLEIADGTVDIDAGYSVDQSDGKTSLRVSGANATVRSLVLNYPGEKEPIARVPLIEFQDVAVDVDKREVTIAESKARDGFVNARRESNGTINFARLIKQVDATPDAKPAATATTTNEPPPPPAWKIEMKRLANENFAVTFDDRVPKPPVVTKVTKLSMQAENVSNLPNSRSNLSVRGTVNGKGTFLASGALTPNPFSSDLRVETKSLNFAVLQPYIDDKVNVTLTSGTISTKGAVKLSALPGKPVAASYRGDLNITNFASIDKPTRQDFLNWKSLYLGGVDFVLEPFKANVNEVALSDFFARIILSAEGRLNLQDIVRKPGDVAKSVTDVEQRKRRVPGRPEPSAPETPSAPTPAPEASSDTTAPSLAGPLDGSGGEKAAAAATPAPAPFEASADKRASGSPAKGSTIDVKRRDLAGKLPENIRIGKITLQGGNVNFSDFFIRPNYTANLTDLGGGVTEMTAAKAGDVELRGKVDKTAPLEILGRVNALSPELFVDLEASAKDIELPPLSPYSIKYAGYGIERGKMSVNVKYLIEDRKLTAENSLYLDQLTFGEKVDSPTATKLPVLLVVSLLKDKDGVIDINLPISGSIDDPQFSVWGLIGRVILNLFTKAVTAPFTLLASLAGSKEELSYVEFESGVAKLDSGDEGKLKSLSKALEDRPQLKLDVGGRVDPEADRESLRKLSIERKVKQQKWNELRREGRAPATPEEVKIEPAEYEKYLRLAYKAEDFPKPRNLIGIAKDVPVPEMENLMYTNAQVSDDDLRRLANQRAQAAKDWIVENGKIPAERVFLVAPKMSTEGIKDKGKPTRVEFTIK
ncbi:MAG: DUF748 domain-containing protein, partial [Burkholderiales bacterium]